jgi:long-chain-fatty-acid--[acyl-carrier-protein] ligase
MRNFAIFVNWVLKRRYKIKITKGYELLKGGKSRLYLPNHPAEIDPIILMSEIVKFHNAAPMISAMYYNLPIAKSLLKKIGAVAVADLDQGVRDITVMDKIREGAQRAYKEGNSILLYPAGQLKSQGHEKLFNKQSAYALVKEAPDDVLIIGVRTYGIWGSRWSRAWIGVSPPFFKTLLISIFYFFANIVFFMPKRSVEIEFYDITKEAKEKVNSLARREFNAYLEEFYNVRGAEKARFIKYHFLSPKLKRKLPKNIISAISDNIKELQFSKIDNK